MADLPGLSPGKVSSNRLRLHRWAGRSQAAAFGPFADAGLCAGEGNSWRLHLSTFMAAKNSDRSTGSSLRRAIALRKTKNSCAPKHRAYFLRKLKAWKEAIIEESRQTMAQLQVDSLREPDLADRASSETDWSIELRTRDRQRKLIAKIDCAIRRLYEGEYGYCEVTGEPISLARLEARPIATMTLEAQERHERIEKVSRDD